MAVKLLEAEMVRVEIVLFLQQLLQLTVEEEEQDKLMALLVVVQEEGLPGKAQLYLLVQVLLTKDFLEVMPLAAAVMVVEEVEEHQQLVVMQMEKTVETVETV